MGKPTTKKEDKKEEPILSKSNLEILESLGHNFKELLDDLPPDPEDNDKITKVIRAGKIMAQEIERFVPCNADQEVAIYFIRVAILLAKDSILRG